jgi:aryl-alcohol dehydrogenase-like predicted oxidoreductase
MIYGTAFGRMQEGQDADDLLDLVFEQGITTFDTARSYDHSEESLGRWIARRGLRDQVNILTKGCNPQMTGLEFSPESLLGELNQSLEALQVDYVDLYTLHRDDTSQDVSVYIETLNDFKAKGKIRAFGASNWEYTRMDQANEYAYAHNLEGFSFGSPAYSLAVVVWDPFGGSVCLSGTEHEAARNWFLKNRIPVFPYSSFARGFFSGKYRTDMKQDVTEILSPWTCQEYICPENIERLKRAEHLAEKKGCTVGQINLSWILAQPFLCCPIFSPSSREHILENLEGMKLKLTEEERLWLNLEEV